MSSEIGAAPQEVNSKSFDLLAIAKAIGLPFAFWAAAVLGVAFVGRQPGVVCATPLAWLMALWVGLRCVAHSRSDKKSSRLIEAGLAGGIFGLLQGILFVIIAPLMGSIKPEEQQRAIVIGVVMVILGALISAVLSMAVGASLERRRAAK